MVLWEMKESWLDIGFQGGAIISLFAKMQAEGVDLVYNQKNKTVMEYVSLLENYLESKSRKLILMADKEIKRYYPGVNLGMCIPLISELHECFEQNGRQYPFCLVSLHIDILTALFISGMSKECGQYLQRLRQSQELLFGKESYLFCRNWCFILFGFVSEYCQDIAISEYEKYNALLMQALKGEEVLYRIHIRIASIKVKKDNEPEHLRIALEQCQIWVDSSKTKISSEIESLVFGMKGIYYRDIGDIGNAVKSFGRAIDHTDNLKDKLYWIVQKGTMLHFRQDKKGLLECVLQGVEEIQQSDEENVLFAEIYNLYGLYYMLEQEFAIALKYLRKAENIGKYYLGEYAELTVKYHANFLLAQYYDGNMEEAEEQLMELLEQMSGSPESYPEIYAMVQNNVLAVSLENGVDSSFCRRMRRILKYNVNAYDLSVSILYKSNLYFFMTVSESSSDEKAIDDLELELEQFFRKNPYGTAYIQFLRGRAYRCYLQGKTEMGYKILEILLEYLENVSFTGITSMYGVIHFNIRLRILLYKKSLMSHMIG